MLGAGTRLPNCTATATVQLGLPFPGAKAEFPIFEDRIATQQLVYLRLARLQNAAQLAKASAL